MKAGLWLTILGMHTCISRCLQAVCCWINDFLMQCSFVFWMWVWSGNVKPIVLQQWRLRSPFCMNHCAPRIIAECGAHKFFFACTRTRSGPFPGDRTEKPQEGPLCPEGLRNPFLTSFGNPWTKSQNLKNPDQNPEFGRTQGEILKKLQKSTLAFNGGWNSENHQFWR
jgi:hypothetical protein